MCSAVEYLGFDEVEEFFGGIMGIIYKTIKINNQKLILAEYGVVDNFPVRIAQFQLPQMENRKYSTGLKYLNIQLLLTVLVPPYYAHAVS
ncbi:hypothetical protein [Flagellimonas baculiformis]|uniref:hypothetical protein n=1 Tax=Flagellimonas baculiformis TaxID=3067310 RepID=UPI00296EE898|nr:hypothetical protein [Muricauda sp. D6]